MAAHAKKICCKTDIKTSEHVIAWTIGKIEMLVEVMQKGESLESSRIEIMLVGNNGSSMKTEWYLKCYPVGTENRGLWDGVSLYLCLDPKHRNKIMRLWGNVKLKVKNRLLPECNCEFTEAFSETGTLFWKYFINRSLLKESRDSFLNSDASLEIQCDITIFQSFECIPSAHVPSDASLSDVFSTPLHRQAWDNLKASNFTDLGPSSVILVFGENSEEEPCHTFPLAARSPVFKTMLTIDMLERSTGRICLPDVSSACGRELIYFLYTGYVRQDANLAAGQ